MIIERRKAIEDRWVELPIEKAILEITDTIFGGIDDRINPIEHSRFCLKIAIEICHTHRFTTAFAEYRVLGANYDKHEPRR